MGRLRTRGPAPTLVLRASAELSPDIPPRPFLPERAGGISRRRNPMVAEHGVPSLHPATFPPVKHGRKRADAPEPRPQGSACAATVRGHISRQCLHFG